MYLYPRFLREFRRCCRERSRVEVREESGALFLDRRFPAWSSPRCWCSRSREALLFLSFCFMLCWAELVALRSLEEDRRALLLEGDLRPRRSVRLRFTIEFIFNSWRLRV